jgi:NADH-quinone oxidoreductase subunit J
MSVLESFLSGQVMLFGVFALGALVTAITMVLYPNPVRSALFLVLNLFCVAVLYLLLNQYFLAAVQVIVYAGAIMVLFLFVIMLLNLGSPDRSKDRLQWQQPVAVGAGLILAAMLALTIGGSIPDLPGPANTLGADTMGTVSGVGNVLYDPRQPYLFPFEVTSILLLVAVIGSVVLAKNRAIDENIGSARESAGGGAG